MLLDIQLCKAKAARAVAFGIGAILLFGACSTNNGLADPPPIVTTPRFGPLDEVLFRIQNLRPDATAAEQQTQNETFARTQEGLIATCMAEKGFTYTPVVMRQYVTSSGDEGIAPDSREFAEQFGFGITIEVPFGAVAGQTRGGAFAPENDPSVELVETMSDAEREAWNEALWGFPLAEDSDFRQGGCHDIAIQQIQRPTEFADLQAEVDRFYASFSARSAPPHLELDREWSACMANAGFSGLPARNRLTQSFSVEWGEMHGSELLFDDDGWLIGAAMGTPREPTESEIRAINQREIETAIADFDCRQLIDFEQRENEIQYSLQTDFVNLHRAELEAWEQHAEALRQTQLP